MAAATNALKWLLGGILLLAVMLAAGMYFAIRTQPGQSFVLRSAVEQLPRFLDGQVEVGDIRSDGLLGGFTLHDLAISDSLGRPFVTADSVRVEYSLAELLQRNIVLVPAEVWAPEVTVETLHGDPRSNVERIFGGGGGGGGPGIAVALRRTALHDGAFVLRMPLGEGEDAGRIPVETLEGGAAAGRYQVLRFRDIQARIPSASLTGQEQEGQRFVIDELSLVGHVFGDPFVIEDLRGEIVRAGSTVVASLDRLWLPDSELAGEVLVAWGGEEPGVEIAGDVEAHTVRFADFRWLEPRLPDGGGTFEVSVSGPLAGSRWRVTSADVQAGDSRLRGSFGIDLGDPLRFADTDLEALPLDLALLDDWLTEPLPVRGVLRGDISVDGPLRALQLEGELTFQDPERDIPPSTAAIDGILRLGESPGADDLQVLVDPLRYSTLRAFLPELEISGVGRARVSASGNLEDGIQGTADITHGIEGAPERESRMSVSGRVERAGEQIRVQLAGELDSLSLGGVEEGFGQELPVGGDLSGSVAASGFLSDLSVSADLATPGGRLRATGRINAREPTRGYRIQGQVEEFALHEWLDDLPRATVLTGEFSLDGSGMQTDELSGTADVFFRDSRVLGADLSRLQAALRASGGRLYIDELQVRSPALTATGSGDLALREGQPPGQVELSWTADSLAVLRPVFVGDEGIVADTLSSLEREILRLDGIDPDTLGAEDAFALGGRAEGELVLRGAVDDFRGEGHVAVADARIGDGSVQRARADLRGHWAGSEDWRAEAVVDFDSLAYQRYSFLRGSGGLNYSLGTGDFDLTVRRSESDVYRVAGELVRDSTSVAVGLRQLELQLDDLLWRLAAPADLRFEDSRLEVAGFHLVGGGDEASEAAEAGSVSAPPESSGTPPRMSIRASGVLDLEGESEFDLGLHQVDLARMERIAQTESLPGGIVDLDLRVRGPAESPRIEGDMAARDFLLGGASLSLIEGTVSYGDRSLLMQVTGFRDGQRLLRVEGRAPADLSFTEVEDRFPDRAIDLTIAADSLPAASALAFLETVEQVQGTLDGEIRLRGTPEDLRPSGSLRLVSGGLAIPDIGLTANDVNAEFTVREDFAVEVKAQAMAGGTARITGSVGLQDLTDPSFDLTVSVTGFQAVDRRDIRATVGGDVILAGSYRAPRVTGQVSVLQGELFIEEFARGAEVIDLSDPAFFDVVDTTLVSVRPVVEAAQNPFLQNLRVDVDLALENDFWLRSQGDLQGMDVEIAGDLIVTFDRPASEFLLVGTLEAERGTYTQFGRQFEVQSGLVEFMGTPGINPSMNIQAVYRLRRPGREQLDILANVEGTLQNPRVALNSNSQPPIPQSDLISLLIFGEPSYALGSGEVGVVERFAEEAATTAISVGVSQIASTFVRQFGIDYFAVTQARNLAGLGMSGLRGQFESTQVEMGRYLGDDLFFALILRPLTGIGGASRSARLPGARLEYSFQDYWTLESYLEDRIPRQGAGFGELDNDFERTWGLSLFREWGY